MPTIREKLAKKTSKLALPKEKTKDHPAQLNNYQEGSFYIIPIEEIKPDPDQPRKYFDKEALNELTESIKRKGVLQPVIIRRDENENIVLVAGERRFRAAKKAGLEQIPAILTTGHPAEISLIENLQRENLKPVEEAEALSQIIQKYNYTQDQLSLAIGKARTTITESLSLNKLPDEIKEECRRADTYPRRLLVEIAKQKTPKAMAALFTQVKKANLKSDQVRQITRKKVSKIQRTPTAIAIDRITYLSHSLAKLNMGTSEESERIQLLTQLQNLKKLIDKLLSWCRRADITLIFPIILARVFNDQLSCY